MNLVITSMVNQTALDIKAGIHKLNATTEGVGNILRLLTLPLQEGPFVWDSVVTGDVVGMFFAGYMVFQVPVPSLPRPQHDHLDVRCQEEGWLSCMVARGC